jgi:hypothetical protein
MPLSLKNKKYPSYKKKSKKKKLGSQKLRRADDGGGGHLEDVFESLQMLTIYNDEYTYPELIFQDNVALYEKLIEYGKYHLTNHAIGTYAHIRNLYLCIFLNRPKIFKLLYNSYYRDHFIEGSPNFQPFRKLENIRPYFSPKVNPDKKVFDFSETFYELMSMLTSQTFAATPEESMVGLRLTQSETNAAFWHTIILLGRVDILSIVQEDIPDVIEFRKNIMEIKDDFQTFRSLVHPFVPNGNEGDEMVQLLTSKFHFNEREISRFDLPDTLLESSINKKLTDSRYISTPEHHGISPGSFYALGEDLLTRND